MNDKIELQPDSLKDNPIARKIMGIIFANEN